MLTAAAPSSARHESYHAAMAVCIGTKITSISRTKDGDGQVITEPSGDDAIEIGIRGAMVLMASFLGGASGCRKDLQRLARLESLGIPIGEARVRAAEVMSTERFDRLRWAFFDALMSRPVLDEDAVRQLVNEVDGV
jgi:hypothetical protein